MVLEPTSVEQRHSVPLISRALAGPEKKNLLRYRQWYSVHSKGSYQRTKKTYQRIKETYNMNRLQRCPHRKHPADSKVTYKYDISTREKDLSTLTRVLSCQH